MHIYYVVAIAVMVGIAVGAGAATGLKAQVAPKAYIVTEVDVTGNMDVFLRDYAVHVQPTVDRYGGRYLVRGGRNVGIEGDSPKARIVISEFDSFEKAQAWREFAGIQENRARARTRGEVAHVHRRGASERVVVPTLFLSPRRDFHHLLRRTLRASPRARGEVGALVRRVRGLLHEFERLISMLRIVDRPPHPDPLPARGAREQRRRARGFANARWRARRALPGRPVARCRATRCAGRGGPG